MSLFIILSKLKSMKRLRMLTPRPTPNIRLHLFMGPKYAVMYMHLKIFCETDQANCYRQRNQICKPTIDIYILSQIERENFQEKWNIQL